MVEADEVVMAGMYYDQFNSSNIAGFYYEHDSQKLTVDFHSGSSYLYSDVPEAVIYSWIGASSMGRFHHYNIAYSYPYYRK